MDGFISNGFSTAQWFGGRIVTCHLVSADVAHVKATSSLDVNWIDVVVCHAVGSWGPLSYGVLLTSTLPRQLEDCDLG